jgi:hypothetical protein
MPKFPIGIHQCSSVAKNLFPLLSVFSVCSVVDLLLAAHREGGMTTDYTERKD